MAYVLRRSDGAVGDSGGSSTSIRINPESNEIEVIHNSKPLVGYVIRVGSVTARSYQAQDWWQTSMITDIIEDKDSFVRFKTLNSEYTWEII